MGEGRGIVVSFWLACALCSALVASHNHRRAIGWFCVGLLCGPCGLLVALFPPLGAAPSPGPAHDDGEERWATLMQDDDGARSAMGRGEGYGTQAIAALHKASRGMADPSPLPTIAAHMAREAEDSRARSPHRYVCARCVSSLYRYFAKSLRSSAACGITPLALCLSTRVNFLLSRPPCYGGRFALLGRTQKLGNALFNDMARLGKAPA